MSIMSMLLNSVGHRCHFTLMLACERYAPLENGKRFVSKAFFDACGIKKLGHKRCALAICVVPGSLHLLSEGPGFEALQLRGHSCADPAIRKDAIGGPARPAGTTDLLRGAAAPQTGPIVLGIFLQSRKYVGAF